LSPYWRWLIENIGREDFERRLLAGERTERGVMRELMRTYADFRGRPVVGEKTPAHLRYVETLLDWFPRGRVVHILRDPRAIYVSELRRRRSHRRKPYSWLMKVPLLFEAVMLVQTTLVWAGAERRHRQLARRFPDRYMLLRFEDMVEDPDRHLRRLFDFVGVETPANATEVEVVSRGFRLGESGLDAEAARRWRRQIDPVSDRWLKVFLGRAMRRLGYAD
ncbi:MAG TPA: sulfotransferase, partial [Candidatus Caenarcaniphilales bacterium]|nr:sulfotransferase [Candidatus Caenarcaniphilales bacterium]